MSVTYGFGAVTVQSDWLNSPLSPVVYGDIAQSINTQYNTLKNCKMNLTIAASLVALIV